MTHFAALARLQAWFFLIWFAQSTGRRREREFSSGFDNLLSSLPTRRGVSD